jgi:hypothetical protein
MAGIRKIQPREVHAVNSYRQTIFPYGYYRRFLQVQGPYKKEKNTYNYSPGLQDVMENQRHKDFLHESINNIIHKKNKSSKYNRSTDGNDLKNTVNQLLRMKFSGKGKKI